mmetsp:Transcript_1108/g.1903  ORF Transcript_1108/g.1903 Transcript_1108/m.1903 type:complete len:810 (+) Transcript_1108:3-2432(+)
MPKPKPQAPEPKPQASAGPQMPRPKPQLPKPKPQAPKPLMPTPKPQQPKSEDPNSKPQSPSSSNFEEDASKDTESKSSTLMPRKDIKRYQAPKINVPGTLESRMNNAQTELQNVYERDALLELREANASRPHDLPLVSDIVKKLNANIGQKRQNRDRRDNRRDDPRRKPGRRDRNDRDPRRDRRRRGQDRQPQFLPPVKALTKSENRFRVGKDKKEVTDDMEKTEASFRRVLNKICPENFESLVEKVLAGSEDDLRIDTRGKMDMISELTFEKAISESVFCATYAKFCVELNLGLPKFDVQTGERLDLSQMKNRKIHDFRRVILNKCQCEFERYTKSEKRSNDEATEEQKLAEVQSKKRILGTIRLIGELYVRDMITLNIITHCTQLLSRSTPIRPDFIQALCKLLETIGRKLDTEYSRYVAQLFDNLKRISEDESLLDFRHRFMIKDSIDLRANNWVPRIKQTKAMTKSEFQKQLKIEELENSRANNRPGRWNSSRQIVRPQGSSMHNRKKSRNVSGDEWSTAGGSSRMRNKGSQDVRSQERSGKRFSIQRVQSRQKVEISRTNNFSSLMNSAPKPARKPEPVKPAAPVAEPASEPAPAPKKVQAVSPEVAKKKIVAFIDEYFQAKDLKEVELCADELGTDKYESKIVSVALLKSVEKKNGKEPMLDVLVHLLGKKKLRKASIEEGYKEILKDAMDLGLAMDYPNLYDFNGYIFGKLICAGGVDLSLLSDDGVFNDDFKSYGDAAKFVFGILKGIKDEKKDDGLVEYYKSSGLDLKKFMRPKTATKDGTIQHIKDRVKDLNVLTEHIQ